MSRSALGRSVFAAAVLLLACAEPIDAKEFDAERHFPRESYLYVAGDAGQLRRAFRETPIGAIAFHPGVRKAIGKLPQAIKEFCDRELDFDDFQREFGIGFFEFLDLFQGQVAMTWPEIDLDHGPRMLLAIELGANKKAITEFFMKVATAEGGGQNPDKETYKGCEVYRWKVRWGPPWSHAIVGDALVLSMMGASLEEVIDRFQGDAKGGALRANPRLRAVRERTRVGDGEEGQTILTFYWNVKGFREKLYEHFASQQSGFDPEQEVKAVFGAIGIETAESIAYQLGLEDGDWEGKLLVESPQGASGGVKLLGDLVAPPSDLSVLEKVPAAASQISCGSIHLGNLLRDLVQLVRGTAAAFGEEGEVDQFVAEAEKATGLSLQRDLYTLGRLDYCAFAVSPPAGSLLPDSVVVCRREQLEPYLAAARKLAAKLGATPRPVQILGHEVTCLRIGGFARAFGLDPLRRAEPPRSFPQALERAFEDPSFGICWAAVDDRWLAVSGSPHAVGRHLEHYSKAPVANADEELMEIVQGRIGRGASFAVVRGGTSVLAVYNTAVSVFQRIAPGLEDVLKPLEIDPIHFPAGEAFADRFRDGFVLVRADKDSFLLHGHRFFSNSVAAVAIPLLAGASAAWISVRADRAQFEAAMRAREAAEAAPAEEPAAAKPAARPQTPEERRLREIGALLQAYLAKTGSRAFPSDPRGGHHAFQLLADAGVLTDPAVIVHPFSSDRPAPKGADGKLVIEESNSSYHAVPWKQGPRDLKSRILCYEKQAFKGGGRWVLFVDLSTRFIEEAEFKTLLEQQTARYAKKEEPEE